MQVGKLSLGKGVLQMRVCRVTARSAGKATTVLQFRIKNSGMPHWSKR